MERHIKQEITYVDLEILAVFFCYLWYGFCGMLIAKSLIF